MGAGPGASSAFLCPLPGARQEPAPRRGEPSPPRPRPSPLPEETFLLAGEGRRFGCSPGADSVPGKGSRVSFFLPRWGWPLLSTARGREGGGTFCAFKFLIIAMIIVKSPAPARRGGSLGASCRAGGAQPAAAGAGVRAGGWRRR